MVDQKWAGTAIDHQEMKALDLKQVVRRNFGALPMIGFASTLVCTWETVCVILAIALSNGGTAGFFWGYILAFIGLGLVYLSLSEMSSMLPTSGGQYFWVAILAPRSCRRFLSYLTGWLCAFTWQTCVAGSAYFAGTLVQSLVALNHPSYVPHGWHGSLLAVFFIAFSVTCNTLLARRLPMMEGILIFVHIIGIVIFIPVWILAPIREGGGPLVEFYNPNGWMSNGVAFMVGMTGPITCLIGFDSSIHMAEEARDSSRIVPRTMVIGYVLNGVLGFFVVISCIYTIGPLQPFLALATPYPIINLFYNATGSYAATNIMTAVLIINTTAAAIAGLAAASRQLWAFARDHGVPFSGFISSTPYDLPLPAVGVSLIIPILIALMNIGSTQVLGIILSMFNSALLISYAISIVVFLFRRLQGHLTQNARFSLGKWGTAINVCALAWISPFIVFSFFPGAPNPIPSTMNWAVVMVGGTLVWATAYYLIWGRQTYTPPTKSIQDIIEAEHSEEAPSEKEQAVSETEVAAAEKGAQPSELEAK